MENSNFIYDIIIIGGGIAGISAMNKLIQNHIEYNNINNTHKILNILLLEADNRLGGRIKTLYHSSGNIIELGAELLHGPNTILMDHIRKYNMETIPVFTWAQGDGGPHPNHPINGKIGYYYFGERKKLCRFDDPLEIEFSKMNKLLQDMGVGDDDDETVGEYLINNGIKNDILNMADAGYANTLCSNLTWLKRNASVMVMDAFDNDGSGELKLTCGNNNIIEKTLFKKTQLKNINCKVLLSSPVESIDYNDTFVKVNCLNGDLYSSKYLIATPSVPCLKKLIFNPSLSIDRLKILDKILFEPALKIALLFRKKFWPDDFAGAICSFSVVPEVWMNSPNCLICFSTSHHALYLGSLNDYELKTKVLSQLDEMFKSIDNLTPATNNLVDLIVQDWAKEPYILGGYSAPCISVSERLEISSPIDKKIFFAGEAMTSRHMVMHAAMETGIKCAELISKLFYL